MINLDDIVVKIKTDLSEFKTDAAGKQLGDLEAKGRDSAKGIGAVQAALGNSGPANSFATGLKSVTNAVDGLSRSQINVIRQLENGAVATRLSGQSLAEYTALRRAGTAADSEAGIIIRNLVAAQYVGQAATSSWRNLWGLLGTSVAGSNASLNAGALAARGLAVEHDAASLATHGLRDAIHTLNPIAASAGLQLGAMGSFAGAARAGIVGIGIAISVSLIGALENAADKVRVLTTNLGALLGGQNGTAAFKAISGAADEARVPITALEAGYQELIIANQRLQAQSGIILSPDAIQNVARAATVMRTLSNAITTGGGLSNDVLRITDSLIQALGKDGTLTSAAFLQISAQSRKLGAAIMQAFGQGGSSIAQFQKFLDAGGGTLQRFNSGMIGISAQLQKQRDDYVPTLIQSYDALTTSVGKFFASFGASVGVGTLMNSLSEVLNSSASGWSHLGEVVKANGGYLPTFLSLLGDVGGGIGRLTDQYLTPFANKLAQMFIPGTSAAQQFSAEFPNLISGAMTSALGHVISWASSAASIIAGVLASMRNLPSISQGSLPPSSFPIPTSGGLGGYGNPFSQNAATNTLINAGYSEDQLGALNLLAPTDLAAGTDTVVPPGFPGDSFRASLNLSSGERLIVVPSGKSLGQHLGGSAPIHLGNFAAGADMTVGGVDAAITPQGGALLSMVSKFSDVFDKVGISQTAAHETVSAAGNNKLNDVIRQGNIQLIAADALNTNKIVAAITVGDSNITGSINSLSSSMQAVMSSNAANAAASASAANASTGVSGAVSGGSGGIVGNSMKDASKSAAENQRIADATQAYNEKTWADMQAAETRRMTSATSPAPAVLGAVTVRPSGDPGSQLPTNSSLMGSSTNTALSVGGGAYPDDSAFGGWGGGAGLEFTGAFAQPGEFTVPQKFKNDSFRTQLNLSGGETVSVKRYPTDKGGDGSGQSTDAAGIRIGIVNIYGPKDGPSVIRSLSQLREKGARDNTQALVHR